MKNMIFPILICSVVLGSGSVRAANVFVNDATGNSSMVTALNLDANFAINYDANITTQFGASNISTSIAHTTVKAKTDTAGRDWYSFTTSQANTQAYFDIDQGMPTLDAWINLYDSTGTFIGFNDDGGIDPGSVHAFDSFLSFVFADPGMYFISVGRWPNQDLLSGENYTLNVSIDQHAITAVTPIPAAVWLFGSGIAGLLGLSRKRLLHASPILDLE